MHCIGKEGLVAGKRHSSAGQDCQEQPTCQYGRMTRSNWNAKLAGLVVPDAACRISAGPPAPAACPCSNSTHHKASLFWHTMLQSAGMAGGRPQQGRLVIMPICMEMCI